MGCCFTKKSTSNVEMNEVVVDAEGRASLFRKEGGEGTVVNVLALDGGGLRGAFTCEILGEFERQLGKPIQECFDLMVGTSAGGLLCLGAGFMEFNNEGCGKIIDDLGEHIFSEGWVQKLSNFMGQGSTLDTNSFEEFLKKTFSEHKVMDEKSARTNVAVTTTRVDLLPATGLLLKSYNTGQAMNTSVQGFPVWLAARCTSAVPAVFGNEPIKFKPADGKPAYTASMADGCFWQNDPVFEALMEAEALWGPNATINILSIGCGYCDIKREPVHGVLVDQMTRDLGAMGYLQLGKRAVESLCRANPKRTMLRLDGVIPVGSSFEKELTPKWREGGRKCIEANKEKIAEFVARMKARLDADPVVPKKSLIDIERPELDAMHEAIMKKDQNGLNENSVLLREVQQDGRSSKWN